MDSASSDATTKRFTCNLQKRIPPWERLNHKDGRENGKNGKVERCPPYARRAGQLPKRVCSMRMTAFCLAMT